MHGKSPCIFAYFRIRQRTDLHSGWGVDRCPRHRTSGRDSGTTGDRRSWGFGSPRCARRSTGFGPTSSGVERTGRALTITRSALTSVHGASGHHRAQRAPYFVPFSVSNYMEHSRTKELKEAYSRKCRAFAGAGPRGHCQVSRSLVSAPLSAHGRKRDQYIE